MTKPTVGQTIYSLNVGNSYSNVPQVLTPGVVQKVGRKYFTVSFGPGHLKTVDFHLEDWREKTDYTARHKLYENEQAREDEVITRQLSGIIGDAFRHGHNIHKLPLDKLRQIVSILRP